MWKYFWFNNFFFQINFERSVVVTSVLVQGEGEHGWVTKFAVQGSKDGVEWRYVVEDGLANENPLVFRGNEDGNSVSEVGQSLALVNFC